MMNANSSRAEPREPRVEPREPTELHTLSATTPAARPVEARPPAARALEPRAAEPLHKASVLGATLRFRGELSAQEDLIVQGSVEGSITHTQSLTIGSDGSMKGDIRARVIVIDGKVDGDLYATESVNIRATAKVRGNIFAPRVGITEGAFFQGEVDMQPSGAQEALATPPLASAAVDKMLSGGGF